MKKIERAKCFGVFPVYVAPIAPFEDEEGYHYATRKPCSEVFYEKIADRIKNSEKLKEWQDYLMQFVDDRDKFREEKAKILPYFLSIAKYAIRKKGADPSYFLDFYPIDIDHMESQEKAEALRDALFNDPNLHPVLSFVSISKRAVKLILTCKDRQMPDETDIPAMKEAINALQEEDEDYIREKYLPLYGGEIDTSGHDLIRATFFSHDEGVKCRTWEEIQAWLAGKPLRPVLTPSKEREINQVYELAPHGSSRKIRELQLLTEEIEEEKIDIAFEYGDFIRMMFAIINEFGEAGREYFLRICKLCPKFQGDYEDKKFTENLSKGNGKSTLGTVFWLAEQAGVDVCAVWDKLQEERQNEKKPEPLPEPPAEDVPDEDEDGEEEGDASTLPPTMPSYDWAPEFMRKVLEVGKTPEVRDLLFFSFITVAGATLEDHVKVLYGEDGHEYYLAFQTVIIGKPASGKGQMAWLQAFAQPLHDAMLKESEKEIADWHARKSAAKKEKGEGSKKTLGPKPQKRIFIIPEDITAASFKQRLQGNKGKGLVISTEIDALTQALQSPYGKMDAMLRKLFHHETISDSRKTDDQYIYIAYSIVGILLTGTQDQPLGLVKNVQGGSFSRWIPYYLRGKGEYKSQVFHRGANRFKKHFAALAQEWEKIRQCVAKHEEIIVWMTDEQIVRWDEVENELHERSWVTNEADMIASVRRTAINLYRMMALMTVIRDYYRGEDSLIRSDAPQIELDIADEDFEGILAMASPLYKHAHYILNMLKAVAPKKKKGKYKIDNLWMLSRMKDVFTTSEFQLLGKLQKINPRTCTTWLKRLETYGYIVRTGKRAEWRKTKKGKNV